MSRDFIVSFLLVTRFAFTTTLPENSPCTPKYDEGEGRCVLMTSCSSSAAEYEMTCDFRGLTRIICCPVSSIVQDSGFSNIAFIDQPQEQKPVSTFTQLQPKTKRISEEKCDGYHKLVTETVEALPLLLGAAPVEQSVPKCDFNNVQLIVGGVEARVGEFPHMVALGYGNAPDYEFLCGGTLISERFVLTAAHCTKTTSGNVAIARLGEHDLSTYEDGAKTFNVQVIEEIIHPEYLPPAKYNDLALLRLAIDVRFSAGIRPACLPQVDPSAGSNVVATGWGRLQYNEDASPRLLKVVIPIIDGQTCTKIWITPSTSKRELPRGIDHSSMICAGDLKGGKDTCRGDSGGPLTVQADNNPCIHTVVGITSFGKLVCGWENSPAIYTRVSNYVPWIESIVWPNE